MYIKNLEIYFTTNDQPLKATGKEAQKIFDRELPNLDEVIEVKIDGEFYSIPRENVLYVRWTPHDEANALKYHIHETFVELKDQIKEVHEQTYKDSFGEEVPINYYFSDLEYWEIEDDGGLYVGGDEAEEDVVIHDQAVIDQYKVLVDLQHQLDEMVGEAK